MGLALPARLVRPAPKALKASKDLSVPRARSGSGGRLALLDRLDRSDRKVRRGKPVAKAQSDPAANADRQDRRALLARPARSDRRVRRVTPASRARSPAGCDRPSSIRVTIAARDGLAKATATAAMSAPESILRSYSNC